MESCACCGYRTLPRRGDYDLCPVCWWEDDGVEPWEFSDVNGRTPVEAQQEFLAERRPSWRRPGKVRRPTRHEGRDPDWRPHELTDDLMARVSRSHEEQLRYWDEERRRVAREVADDPEGPFTAYNAGMQALRAQSHELTYGEVLARTRELGCEHGVVLPEAYLELLSRQAGGEHFLRRHPFHAAAWMIRYARPRTFRRRWQELRSGSFRMAG